MPPVMDHFLAIRDLHGALWVDIHHIIQFNAAISRNRIAIKYFDETNTTLIRT